MTFPKTSVLLTIAAVSSTGCAALGGKTETTILNGAGATVLSSEANQRAVYFASGDKRLRYCAEPPPDVALNKALEVAANAEFTKISAEASAKLSSSAIELAGRSQTVLLARELLYRTCEMYLNGEFEKTQVIANYTQVVALIEKLGSAALETAEAEAQQAATELTKAQTDNMRQQQILNAQ